MITTTAFFDGSTSTFSYIIFDPKSRDAVIIDPVLDYEPISSTVSFVSINRLRDYIHKNELNIRMILDTHVHADHMTGAYYLKNYFNAPNAIGENFVVSQAYFAKIFELEKINYAYDILLKNNQEINAGNINIKILLTPGHTPSCASYLIDNSLFVGDALFQPERGCGRADFPGGSAQELYKSIKNIIYNLPDNTKIYVGHDYPQAQEDPKFSCSVGESKQKNIMLDNLISEEEFIQKRAQKDQNLQPPRLLLPAMQVNIMGGRLPERFLRLPLTLINSNS